MYRKHFSEVERKEIGNEGFKGFFARYLWSRDDDVPHFAMRMMEMEPGGHTSYHSHLEEHEFYFLEGESAYVDGKGNETNIKAGDTIYVPADEPHQIKNVGDTLMRMICMIPIFPGGDGKSPAPRPDKADAGY
jgi:quercetin dioxygenase-like cupin family protein